VHYKDGMRIIDTYDVEHELRAIGLLLTFEYSPTRIPLELKTYGDALVASASFDLDQSRVTYAIVESPSKEPTFGVSFRPRHPGAETPTAVLGSMGHVEFVLPKKTQAKQV
jgi:hypothetical protein